MKLNAMSSFLSINMQKHCVSVQPLCKPLKYEAYEGLEHCLKFWGNAPYSDTFPLCMILQAAPLIVQSGHQISP